MVEGCMKKRLFLVKSWLGLSKVGVDLLVGTGLACNLISTALCKKLGVVIVPQAHTLVGFSGHE